MNRHIPNIITLTRIPMAILWEGLKVPYIILVCLLVTFDAIQEGHLIRTEKDPDV